MSLLCCLLLIICFVDCLILCGFGFVCFLFDCALGCFCGFTAD